MIIVRFGHLDFEWLTLENDSISLEDLELVHLRLSHLHNGIIILLRFLNLQLVRGLLLLENGSREVFLCLSMMERWLGSKRVDFCHLLHHKYM